MAGTSIDQFGEGVCGVYVITGAHNMCKIGISTDPELRLASLQTGSHVNLKIHYVLVVKSIDPRQIEMLAHKILDKYRCAGEWFDVTPQMAEDAVNQAALHYGIKTTQTTSATFGSRPIISETQKFFLFLIAMLTGIFLAAWMGWIPHTDY